MADLPTGWIASDVGLPGILNAQATAINGLSHRVFNVLDYGAIGNGTTNDFNAVQSALTACFVAGGGQVVLPGNGRIYRIDSTMVIRNNTQLTGQGFPVLRSGTGDPLLYNYYASENVAGGAPGYTGHGRIALEGIVFDMRGHIFGVPHNCMTFAHAQDITVRDCIIRNVSGYHAIELHACKNALVQGVRFEGYIQSGVSGAREAIQLDSVGMTFDDGTGCTNVAIVDCYCGPSPTAGECTLPWGRLTGSHTQGTNPHTGVTVARNYIETPTLYGIGPQFWTNFTITDNVILTPATTGIILEASTGGVVARNTVIGAGSIGIAVGTGLLGATKSVLVQGNLIQNGPYGIRLNYAQGCTFLGNKVAGSTSTAFLVANSTRCVISGNDCTTKADGVTANGYTLTTSLPQWLQIDLVTVPVTLMTNAGATAFTSYPALSTTTPVAPGGNYVG